MVAARRWARLLEVVVQLVQRIGPLDRLINRIAINRLVARVPPRPNPFSMRDRYTSWASLTEREWSGRHLPAHPVDAPVPSAARRQTATVDAAAALFVRDGEMTACPKSTALFPAFAQWFTDGFLRTDRTRPAGHLRDTRKNESNHEIDLAQLYGLKRAATDQLRALTAC
jgi:prostaglandin-endoperoxide synthase 2